MLQSKKNPLETKADIAKRLEILNRWQEEQKQMLHDRQIMQRKLLGLEHKNMYQKFGFNMQPKQKTSTSGVNKENIAECSTKALNSPSIGAIKMQSPHCDTIIQDISNDEDDECSLDSCDVNAVSSLALIFNENGVAEIETQEETDHEPRDHEETDNQNDYDDLKTPTYNPATSGYCTEEPQNLRVPRTKKTFLRRGEGLKARFKIDPEVLRINNLPRYKYSNAHPKFKPQNNVRRTQPSQSKISIGNSASQVTLAPARSGTLLKDAREKRFQQMLLTAHKTCNSTPDSKSIGSASVDSISFSQTNMRFTAIQEPQAENQHNSTLSTDSNPLPAMTWSKVLDSQQIKPIDVHELRTQYCGDTSSRTYEDDNEDEHLSIFELLEKKASAGVIDMNSSCIERLMGRKLQPKDNVGAADESSIPVDARLKDAGIKPSVQELDLASCDGDGDLASVGHTQQHGEFLDSADSPQSSARSAASRSRVRFSEEPDTREFYDDTVSEASTLAPNEYSNDERAVDSSTEMFHQFKNALFSALQTKAERGTNAMVISSSDTSSLAVTPYSSSTTATQVQMPYNLSEDLQEKTQLVKERLVDLEKEITTFKENNIHLLRAKQEFEVEKAHFVQERLDEIARLNDEKIQMEIYLHDERMRIEEEKKKFEQQMRLQKTAAQSKQRKEIISLKQEVQELQLQLKQKDQTHAAAQARLRAQMRTMERDQKQLHADIERLTKENKRLQNDNLKLSREHNNKMLHEINRNIAKLAPKLSPVTCFEPQPIAMQHSKITIPTAANKQPYKPSRQTQKNTATSKATSTSNISRKTVQRNNGVSSDSEAPLSFEGDFGDDDDDDDDVDIDIDIQRALKLCEANKTTQNAQKHESQYNKNTENDAHTAAQEFKREIINADGSKDIWYPNGNLKKISADGMTIRMLYFNKDIKETNVNEGTVKYYYAETNTWHTTYLDGLEILEFPNGQTEHRHKDGVVEIHFPNNSIKIINPADENKLEEWRFADGTNVIKMRNGDKILMLPNGQKEIHTKSNKRREYPDGTVKIVYADGSQETRYSNGRIRLKDNEGNLVMDTDNAT